MTQQQNIQGETLQDLLPYCQEGCILECIQDDDEFTIGNEYEVSEVGHPDGLLHIWADDGHCYSTSREGRFIIKSSVQCDYDDAVNISIEQEHQEQQDSSESVDGHKAFDVLKGMIR